MKRHRALLASCLFASRLRRRAASAGVLAIALATASCASLTPAKVNRDITTGIASAGAAADKAEEMYQTQQIPQTEKNRYAINALGNAYNEAREAWLLVLTAESVYRGSQQIQMSACAPGVKATNMHVNGAAATCEGATANVAKAKEVLATQNAALTAKVSAMSSATAAVTALSKGK